MDNEKEDVKIEEYREEKKKWVRSNEEPEAYSFNSSWGLVRDDEVWRLFMVVNAKVMKEIANIPVGGSEPPFIWAREKLIPINEKRKSTRWDEREIGDRKPGTEGFHGGRPIPMQTVDTKKLASDARRRPPGSV